MPSGYGSPTNRCAFDAAGFALDVTAVGGTAGWTLSNSGGAATLTGSANNDSITDGFDIDLTATTGGGDLSTVVKIVGASSLTVTVNDMVMNWSTSDPAGIRPPGCLR